MNVTDFLKAFAGQAQPDFATLPLCLPKPPGAGQTWSITWQVKDRALLVAGSELLTLVADDSGARSLLACPFPGRIKIFVQDARYISYQTTVAELEYGIGLSLPSQLPPPAEAKQLRQTKQSLASEQRTIAHLEQQIKQMTAALPSNQDQNRLQNFKKHPRLSDCDPTLVVRQLLYHLQHLLQQLKQQPGKDHTGLLPSSSQETLLELLRVLDSLSALGITIRDGGNDREKIVTALYQKKIAQARAFPQGLPQAVRDQKVQCWEELFHLHLPNP